MKIVNTLRTFKYRMDLRIALRKEPYDLLIITKEEINKELNRRAKKK